MLLKKLIKNYPRDLKNLRVAGLTINSKEVKKGYIFFAIKGHKLNGENFIDQAIKKGASLIVCSSKCKFKSKKKILFKTKNVRKTLNIVASKFFKLKPNNIFAVTGTNGKTSVADFFYQILKFNKVPVATIGTLGVKYNNKIFNTSLTSPDAITLHKQLQKIKEDKINNVIIEASSHGLVQNRLDNLNFKGGIFTNFSQDHLDYHKTMKAYFNSKLILFKKLLSKKRYVIADKNIKEFKILKKISKEKKLKLIDIYKYRDQIQNLGPNFVNSFQKKNLLMAIAAARICKLSDNNIKNALKSLKHVNGRLDLVKKFSNNVKVFIDYAHTPDALKEVLKSIKNIYNSNISLVFGCGGERDKKKRPLMAKIAKDFCKKIYVTDDNPRKEDPKKIRKKIIYYLKGHKNCFNIGNRSLAIQKAIKNSEPNEVILVAGKGHENYQDYGTKIIKISDKQIIKKIYFKKNKNRFKFENYLLNSSILSQIVKKEKKYNIDGLSIDSRKINKNNLFVALKGKKIDGNQFINKALDKGASYAVSSKKNLKFKKRLITVKDPVGFLNKYARLKRQNSNAMILGITGSAGKTTLKNMLYNLLNIFGDTYASPRSFNNHYGVPISLSNLNINHQFGIFEIGMSKFGEIKKLSKIVRPDIGVITNIAEAHIENFKNIKGIAKAKSEIIENIALNGTIILNRDDKFFNSLNKKAKFKKLNIISFGKDKKSDIRLTKIKKIGQNTMVTINIRDFSLNFKIKNINVYNVLASIAVLRSLKLDIKKTIKKFKSFEPTEGRGKTHKIKRYQKSFYLVDESYNANPFSVKIAIQSFSKIYKGKHKKYLFLGDMLELGKKSEIYHSQLSRLINNSDIDKVFVKGEKSLFTYKKIKKKKRGNIFQCKQDIDLILKNIISNNDYLMIKGSNATGLNDISKKMIKGSNVI